MPPREPERYRGPDRRRAGRWTDDRIDDFLLHRYPEDQKRHSDEHGTLRSAIEELRDEQEQRRRDQRTQTVAIIVALIAAAATLGAAIIASGGIVA